MLDLKLPTWHGLTVTARIRFTTTFLHFGGYRVWMLGSRCDGRTARDVRRLPQDRLPALSSCSISIAMWRCERPRTRAAWMTDALTKLVNLWPASRISELMPWTFKKQA